MAKRPGDITPGEGLTADSNRTEADLKRYSDDALSTESDTVALDLAADDDTSAETDQIKAKIEETRAGLGETIDKIQERLSFANISEQVSEQVNNAIETAKDSVYEATIGKVADFMKTQERDLTIINCYAAKDNPLPFILIGVGAAFCLSGLGKSSSRTMNYRSPARLTAGRRQQGSTGYRFVDRGHGAGQPPFGNGYGSDAAGTAVEASDL